MSSLSGPVAEVKWSYLTVATVQHYVIDRDEQKQLRVMGTIASISPMAIGADDLVFVATFAKGAWRFPLLDPVPAVPGPFVARLGAQLRE